MTRVATPKNEAALFPGCTHARFIDVNHADHWLHGGETKLDNLVALCTFHHTLEHEGGWRVEMEDGAPRFPRPDAREHPAVCAPVEAPAEVLAALRAELEIDEETGLTDWDASRADYHACVQVACEPDEVDRPAIEWLLDHGYAMDWR